MSSSLKYLLLVAPAALMIAILFLYPLGFSLVSAFTAPGQPFTLDHFRKVYALYASDVLFSLLIVLISVALLALFSLAGAVAQSPTQLALMRFLTGLGLGAVMPNCVTLVAEYMPERRKGEIGRASCRERV